jgi:EAL domain-containing protein (putative c-di-GMP-specific phosphodiesterase class I)
MVRQAIAWRVLVVDDDDALLRAHARALTNAGHAVTTALDGIAAAQALKDQSFDVILSDIDMPGMNGMQLLEHVREYDLDVPVVLITGTPTMETALKAIEHGALRYLIKPVELREVVKVADDAARLYRIALAKREALTLAGGVDRLVGDRAGLVASFGRALDSLHVAYQPIVSWSKKSVFAYEALLRSREPTLPHPGAVLDAAERLGRVHELGRVIRAKAIEPLNRLADEVLLFINLHPSDLLDDHLFAATGALTAFAQRIVLEITERASLDGVPGVQTRVAVLRELGFRIAIDDLGAGYAGLSSFALFEPDIVKLDMALVRNLHQEPTKQKLVRTLVTTCQDLGMLVTAEGVETREELEALERTGCDLMQGYLFARPDAPFSTPSF